MDMLELALNPSKANRRFSPFSNSMPEGMVRRLQYTYGDRASADPSELAIASRDAAAVPAAMGMALKRRAWAIVRPSTRGDLFGILKFGQQNMMPVVPRGAGTSGYGGAVPTEGGIVVDLRGMNQLLALDKANGTVTVEPGIRFWDLERRLNQEGFALRQYPTSARGSTVGGWIATGGGGVGSLKYGPFRNDIVKVVVIRPDGHEATYEGEEIDLVSGAWGITGFIVEATLRVRPNRPLQPFLATWDNLDSAMEAAARLAEERIGFHLAVNPEDYSRLVNEAAKQRLLPTTSNILFVVEAEDAQGAAEAEGAVRAIVEDTKGTLQKPDAAKKAWDARFDHLNVKRLGPSVVVAEGVVEFPRLGEAYHEAEKAVGPGRQDIGAERGMMWAIAISPTEADLIYYRLEEERRAEYPAALGNSLAFVDAVKRVGGRSYNTGVLLANESKAVLGKERVRKLRAFKREFDRNDIFNPGPVLGARMRGLPLPVFPLFMSANAPALKLVRHTAHYRGGETYDPSFEAVRKVLGETSGATDLAALDYEIATCIFCGNCNDVAPETPFVGWETATARGRVQAARAILLGKVAPTRHLYEQASQNPLSYAPDSVCPTLIPIARVTDLLLATCAETLGPLPEHAALVANVAKEGNVLGKPRDKRTAWAQAIPWDGDSRALFLPDDIGAYDAVESSQAFARVATNADVKLAYAGKLDTTSGATLVEAGQRGAAREALKELLADVKKRRTDVVVSHDANAIRTVRLDWPIFAEQLGIADFVAPRASHATELISGWLKTKRIELAQKWEKTVVWHAPEALDPKERAYGADILKALGAKVLDGPTTECGHGRGLEKRAPEMQQRIAEAALRAAVNAGAQAIVTANPGCAQVLRTAAKKAKVQIEVADLVTLVAQSMKVREGGGAVAVTVAPAEPEKPAEPEIPPEHFRVEFVKEKVVLAVHKNQTILEAGEEAGLELPSSCRAGSCDTCSARWEGAPADQSIGVALTAEQQKSFVLTCIAKPRGAIKIWANERPK